MANQQKTKLFEQDFSRIYRALSLFLVLYVWARLVFYMVNSFAWPMDGDLSFLYYIAKLMNEHDYVPYRDIHETSFFGTFIFYSFLTRIIGYSTFAFHWADIFFFSCLALTTFFLLKPFGKLCAWLAIGLFGEFYFSMGIGVRLQRDFVALLPAAFAILIVSKVNIPLLIRAFIAGALFGIASCIKPQFAAGIALASLGLTVISHTSESALLKNIVKIFFFTSLGLLSIWIIGFIWLATHHVVWEFMDMATNYLPAYSSVSGRNFVKENTDMWTGATNWLMGTILLWIIPILLGAHHFLNKHALKNRAILWSIIFLLFWLLYLCYVPMAGKYWGYHILPSYYFLAVLLSFIVSGHQTKNGVSLFHLAPILLWSVFAYWVIFKSSFLPAANINPALSTRLHQTTNELIVFLKNNLKPGDQVQPHVTHTRGPIFSALLATGVLPATPYLENYLLYHDVHSKFVQNAREKFLSTMKNKPPRYIIKTPSMHFFSGKNTENAFDVFEIWLQENYVLVNQSSATEKQSPSEKYMVFEYNKK